MADYPSTPPGWLAQWPSAAALAERFSLPVRRTGKQLALRDETAHLDWGKVTFHTRIANHTCTWRLEESGNWTSRCTCNYPEGRCIHAFAATLLLEEICQNEQWPLPVPATTVQTVSLPQETTQTSRQTSRPFPSSDTPAVPIRRATPPGITFRQHYGPQPESNHGIPAASSSGLPQKSLLAEMDFQTGGNYIGVRFYTICNGLKELQRISWVRHDAYCIIREKSGYPPKTIWPEWDRIFLCEIYPKLQKLDFAAQNLNTLHLTKEETRRWLQRWAQDPNRFIERLSQKPVQTLIPQPLASLHFELHPAGNAMHISAVFLTKDNQRYHMHQLLRMLKEDSSGFLVRSTMEEFSTPVPWEHLRRHFSSYPTSLPLSELESKLPLYLNGRLDLLETGKYVQRRIEHWDPPALFLQYSPHGHFEISLRAGKKLLPYPNSPDTTGTIQYQAHQAVVSFAKPGYGKTLYEALRSLESQLGALVLLHGNPMHILGTERAAEILRAFWQSIPANARKTGPGVESLLVPKAESPVFRLHLQEQQGLVKWKVTADIHGLQLTNEEIRRIAGQGKEELCFHKTGTGWFSIDAQALQAAMEELAAEGITLDEKIELKTRAAGTLRQIQASPQLLQWDPQSLPLAKKLLALPPDAPMELPQPLPSILRPYQQKGVEFLLKHCRNGIGAILADDMGLGKTLQILSLLLTWRQEQQRCGSTKPLCALVVCPASVTDTWREQAERFAPNLRIAICRGTKKQRESLLTAMMENPQTAPELLITHYGLLRADCDILRKIPFQFAILDEAQTIKTPTAQVTLSAMSLQADFRFCLTGTPLENSLRDLWSILHFIAPGLCGTLTDFLQRFTTEIGRRAISRILSLLMLRRTKASVAPELPAKTEETIRISLPETWQAAYTRELARQKVFAMQGGYTDVLAALMHMRRFCCSPQLVQREGLEDLKIDFLLKKLQDLQASGHSVLVFSQFTSLLSLLQSQLTRENIPWLTITGETPISKRPEIVRTFQESSTPMVLLLSLKAAGTGLTLTRADYVFLFDPWWNPSVENQAIDRTHRIGQEKPIFAYRLILQETVEEKVLEVVQQKRELFQNVIEGTDASGSIPLSLNELRSLLQ